MGSSDLLHANSSIYLGGAKRGKKSEPLRSPQKEDFFAEISQTLKFSLIKIHPVSRITKKIYGLS